MPPEPCLYQLIQSQSQHWSQKFRSTSAVNHSAPILGSAQTAGLPEATRSSTANSSDSIWNSRCKIWTKEMNTQNVDVTE